MEEWVVSQFTPLQIFNMLPNDTIQALLEGVRLDNLSIIELALIFSHVPLSSVLSCMLINKKCYRASRLPQFWNLHVKRRINNDKYPFDTFSSPVKESLRDQCEWLFIKGWLRVSSGKTVRKLEIINIDRKTNNNNVFRMVFEKHSFKSYALTHYEMDGNKFSTKYGYKITKYLNHDHHPYITIEYDKGDLMKVCMKCEDGSLWEGQGCEDKSDHSIVPHGMGVWTFTDGTTLKGPDVAKDGKPVVSVDYREWKRLKRDE